MGFEGKKRINLKTEFEKLLNHWKSKVIKENLFEPQAVYGYFKCRKVENNNLSSKIHEEEKKDSELTFEFPRSSLQKHLCLSDYFDSRYDDIVAFQSVTMGNKVAQIIEKWNNENRYSDAYYLHGLAVETTEALADWVNYVLKRESKIGIHARSNEWKAGGLRYSWGYPSCPDVIPTFLSLEIIKP